MLMIVKNLKVEIMQSDHSVHVLRGITLTIEKGQRIGILGESGSGKSMTARAMIRLLPKNAVISEGEIFFKGENILHWTEDRLQKIRGKEIAIILQDARAALNPLLPIGKQMRDIYARVHGGSRKQASAEVVEVLKRVALPNPERVSRAYPHELSGGMCQRCLIAMALICSPTLLIADEPTTGLDVTIQAQILDLILKTVEEIKGTLLFISHDMSVIARCCTDIGVMYCGQIVERGSADRLLSAPMHPYTKELVKSFLFSGAGRMPFIPGLPPDLRVLTPGCPFAPRCKHKGGKCDVSIPPLREVTSDHFVACHEA